MSDRIESNELLDAIAKVSRAALCLLRSWWRGLSRPTASHFMRIWRRWYVDDNLPRSHCRPDRDRCDRNIGEIACALVGCCFRCPIVSILAFVMTWLKTGDLSTISRLARETLILVPLGFPCFIPFALADRWGLSFWAIILGRVVRCIDHRGRLDLAWA